MTSVLIRRGRDTRDVQARRKDHVEILQESSHLQAKERGLSRHQTSQHLDLGRPASRTVIFRWWKISLRSEYRSTKPGEVKESHEDFLENSHLQVQIALIFGARILDHVFNLCEGKFDFLERLSDNLLLSIISYLDLEDIARLSQTSCRFAKLCMADKLWEQIVQSACDNITPEMRALAADMGWRQMFFTNKLQLQRRLRKRRERQESQRDSQL
ncbi:F-box only protein 36 [Diceros bicornis minor]|uniref:F-box only protein 36 n=1 Tax=Diceros bicornis minor TaxID=77932 RepID=UPI0026F11CF1|nr:F-box only protein 36 [Diceros bicornis minor]XP_058389147.1 F-box only protein 36 [Diceros bicornis minor]